MHRLSRWWRPMLVATLVVLLAVTVFYFGNRRQSFPRDMRVDAAVQLPAEILWTGGACVELQTPTAWWGWRSNMEGVISIDDPHDTQWTALNTWDRISRVFRKAPCATVMLNGVEVALPDDLQAGAYRLCDRERTCLTIEVADNGVR